MSLARVNQLQPLDASVTINVSDLLTPTRLPEVLGASDGYKYLGEVASFAALRTLVPSQGGLRVKLRGWNNGSSTGGGDFISVMSAAADDGGLIASSGAAYHWRRNNADNVTPQMFGAVADGTTDDYAAFVRAIAAIGTARALHIPRGTYYISSTIAITATRTFIGEDRNSTILNFADGVHGFNLSPNINYPTFSNLKIRNKSTAKNTGFYGIYANAGVRTTSIGYLTVDSCEILGFDVAVYCIACQIGFIRNCDLWANNRGYYSKMSINMRLTGNRIQLNTIRGIHIDGDSTQVSFSCGTLISNNEIFNNGASGGDSVYIAYNEHFTLINNMIDVPATGSVAHVVLNGVARGTIGSNWIGASNGVGIQLGNCLSINVTGNNILSSKSQGITITGSTSQCSITGNVLEANTLEDISLSGSSVGYNVISGNICGSTTAANSIGEAGAYHTVVTGNICKKAVILNTAGGSVNSGNITG